MGQCTGQPVKVPKKISSAPFELTGARQASSLRLARWLVVLPCRLLAGTRAELGALAAGAGLHLQQRFADTRQVAAPVALREDADATP